MSIYFHVGEIMSSKTKKANQRLVNEAFAHLSKTKQKSVVGNKCSYAGSGCAFSPALKDPQSFGGSSIASAIIRDMPHLLHDWAKDCDGEFANAVQACHDLCSENKTFFEHFSTRLKDLCSKEGYDFPKKV